VQHAEQACDALCACIEQYAARVAAGYRPPLHSNLPASFTSIIQVKQLAAVPAVLNNQRDA
jgi:hypothetical protein